MELECRNIRGALAAGQSSEDIAAHLVSCEACRIASVAGQPSEPPITRETELLDPKADSMVLNRIVLLTTSAATLVTIFLLRPRPDLDEVSGPAFVAVLAFMAVSVSVLIWGVTRPLYRPGLSASKVVAIATLAIVGVVTPIVFIESSFLAPMTFAQATFRCFGTGFLFTIPFIVIGAKRVHPAWRTIPTVLLFVGAALLGNLVLLVHCPVSDPMHVLSGHTTLVPIFGLVGFIGAMLFWKRR